MTLPNTLRSLLLALPCLALVACASGMDDAADLGEDPPTVDGATPLPDGAASPDAGAPALDMRPSPDAGAPAPDGATPAPDLGGPEPDAAPAWDGEGPFPGACRLDITGGAADRRLRWVYDDRLDVVLERVDEGLDGTFEREYTYTWQDGPARVPCADRGPPVMRTPAADLDLADPLPVEGGALREGCGPDGLRDLSGERRLVEQITRIYDADGSFRRITRSYAWDAAGRLTTVEQTHDAALAPDFAPAATHRHFDADYDGQGRLTRSRARWAVVSTLDAEDALGFVEQRRSYAGGTVTVTETRDFEPDQRPRTLTFDDGWLSRVSADGVVRVIGRDARGRVTHATTSRDGQPLGRRGRTHELDDAGRVIEVVESLGRDAQSAVPTRRATLTWHPQGNLSRIDFATRRDGRWVAGESWSYGYGCW